MSFSWLVLAIPVALALPFSTSRRARWLGLYLMVLWLTGLCSLKFEQLLQAITYGEMLISKPRLVHLFAYVVIGLGWSGLMAMAGTTARGRFSPARALGASLMGGVLFALVWKQSVPGFSKLFATLNVGFLAVFGLLILSLRGRLPGLTRRPFLQPSPLIAGLTFIAFALPAGAATLGQRWKVMVERNVRPESLFGARNPLDLAPETLEYFQTAHPPRCRLLIEPGRPHLIGIYAPVYVLPLLGNVGADGAQLQLGREGRHPVYDKAMLSGTSDLSSVRAFLDEKRVAHMLGAGAFAPAFLALASRSPSEFVVRYVSHDGSNVVLEYLKATTPR